MVYLKSPDVRVAGLRPEMVIALVVADQTYHTFGFDLCVVTSAADGKHEPGSLHYVGLAFDLRTADPGGAWAMSEGDVAKVAAAIQARLGDDYDVVVEQSGAPGSTAAHIHIEFQPKRPLTS